MYNNGRGRYCGRTGQAERNPDAYRFSLERAVCPSPWRYILNANDQVTQDEESLMSTLTKRLRGLARPAVAPLPPSIQQTARLSASDESSPAVADHDVPVQQGDEIQAVVDKFTSDRGQMLDRLRKDGL